MEEIKYPEVLSRETDPQKIEEMLKGYDMTTFEPSQYVVGGPVDAGMVLSKVVYPAYVINPNVKEEIEQILYEMLSQTDYDVYIATLYIMSELFKEKYEIAPFKMNTEKILKRLKKELQDRKTSFQNGLRLPNGYVKKSIWEELVRFDQVAKEEYGINLL